MRFIAFSSKTERSIWSVGALLVIIFGLWDPRIIGSRPDTKKQLFAATRFQLTEWIRGASSADRSSMLQMNETSLRKNALKKSIDSSPRLHQSMEGSRRETNIWFETNSQPNFLTPLPFGPRSPFWTASCPSKLLFFKGFILRSTNTLFVPRSLQSWVSTIQSVVLTAEVVQFLFFIQNTVTTVTDQQ